jgi:cytochrome c oxidase assembly factor CtaG
MTTPQFLLSCWGWHPVVLMICAGALLGYAKVAGFRRVWPSGSFVAAVVLFYLTLASPVNALADGLLFSAHMLQHLLLLLVIPALLLLGWPGSAGVSPASFGVSPKESGVPRGTRATKTESVALLGMKYPPNASPGLGLHPFAAWLAGLSAMWVWHERTLCNAATTSTGVRALQIASLIVLGSIFWWPVLGPRLERRLPPLLGVAYLFSACVGCTILGILITFAPVGVVCPVYMHPVDPLGLLPLIRQSWGITPAVDQQAGGLMMWVPACGIYLSGVIALLAQWYRCSETSDPTHESVPGFPGTHVPGENL